MEAEGQPPTEGSPDRKQESENEVEALASQPIHTPTSSEDNSSNSSLADDESSTPIAQFDFRQIPDRTDDASPIKRMELGGILVYDAYAFING